MEKSKNMKKKLLQQCFKCPQSSEKISTTNTIIPQTTNISLLTQTPKKHLSPNFFQATQSNQLKPIKILIFPQKSKFISIKTSNSKQNLDNCFVS